MSTRRELLKLAAWIGGGALTLRACGFVGSKRRPLTDAERKAFPEAGEVKLDQSARGDTPSRPAWSTSVDGLPLKTVVVKSSAMAQSDSVYVAYSVANYMRMLLGHGFELDEISEHTKAIFQLDIYVGQVSNGGYGQYVENTKLGEPTVRYCRQALEMIGASPYLASYDRMLHLVSNPSQAGNLIDGAFGATTELKVLTKEYFALQWADPLGIYVKRFLNSQDWFHVVPDEEFANVMAWIYKQKSILTSE